VGGNEVSEVQPEESHGLPSAQPLLIPAQLQDIPVDLPNNNGPGVVVRLPYIHRDPLLDHSSPMDQRPVACPPNNLLAGNAAPVHVGVAASQAENGKGNELDRYPFNRNGQRLPPLMLNQFLRTHDGKEFINRLEAEFIEYDIPMEWIIRNFGRVLADAQAWNQRVKG